MGKPDAKKRRKPVAASSSSSSSSKLPRALTQALLIIRSALLIALLGAFANVSQLTLAPVYGSIPAAAWHPHVLATGCFAGWAGNLALRHLLPIRTAKLLPLVALCVPTAQFFLFRLSGPLGPRIGPLVTEAATLFPLAALTASSVADAAEQVPRAPFVPLPAFLADAAPGLLSYLALQHARARSAAHIAVRVGSAFHYTRMGMELCLAGAWAALAPSAYLVLALPALLHTALVNPHVATPAGTAALDGCMRAEGWALLARRESVTGYISVAQNTADMARVLRADHSLLGGDWVDYRGPRVTEPVYSVFVMLEAVRLVGRREPLEDADATALVIGLGIGTLPSALVTHGIDTKVVEIDPAVYDFARQYFQLQETRPAVIEDAVTYTDRLVAEGGTTFDYIVHDVFTGGAEPVDLFTLEFLQNLHDLLNDDGVIAINYAGNLVLPTPKIILQTIQAVFPVCRIFRESPRDPDFFARTGSDFTNLIFFCRKTPANADADTDAQAGVGADPEKALPFREPTDEDCLKSRARFAYLKPRYEVTPGEFLGDLPPKDGGAARADEAGDKYGVLRKGETGRVLEWHRKSAVGHWMIMRSVFKSSFWENW